MAWRSDAAGTVAAGPADKSNMVPPWRLLMMLASWLRSDGEDLPISRQGTTIHGESPGIMYYRYFILFCINTACIKGSGNTVGNGH